jgi:hypothetical protein
MGIDRLFCTPLNVRCRQFFSGLIISQRMRTVCARGLHETDRCPQLSVPIDAELKARLEAAAAREDRPVASFVRRIVVRALDGEREGRKARHKRNPMSALPAKGDIADAMRNVRFVPKGVIVVLSRVNHNTLPWTYR